MTRALVALVLLVSNVAVWRFARHLGVRSRDLRSCIPLAVSIAIAAMIWPGWFLAISAVVGMLFVLLAAASYSSGP